MEATPLTSSRHRHAPRPRTALLRGFGLAAVLAGALAGPGLGATPDPVATGAGIGAATVPASALTGAPAGVSGITLIKGGFDQPVFVTHAFDDRLFVVERTGRIRILRNISGTWTITGTFLDLRGKVATGGSEQGLLGLAFHPDYRDNCRFYVNYTNLRGDTVVAEFRRRSAGEAAPGSKRVLLTIDQPFDNHNGGWLGFWGNLLYISTGDGGSGGDPYGNGQDTGSRLGKILRIRPLDPDGSGPRRFSIPRDNPFVGKAGLDEIWAYGLRNPWRNSFDRETGDLYVGDVGQDRYEEISMAGNGRGRNFGWDRLEGRHLYPSGGLCSTRCRTLPIVEYGHGGNARSVVGGYVSRRAGASLEGRYLFADTYTGGIWDIPAGFSGGSPGTPLDTDLFLVSFGEGFDGRLYVVDLGGGVHRVDGS